MSSILDQELITIKQAAKMLPNRPHFSTVWRWLERGCRGHKLKSWLIGGQRYTTKEALEEFFAAINGDAAISSSSRKKAIKDANKELEKFGL